MRISCQYQHCVYHYFRGTPARTLETPSSHNVPPNRIKPELELHLFRKPFDFSFSIRSANCQGLVSGTSHPPVPSCFLKTRFKDCSSTGIALLEFRLTSFPSFDHKHGKKLKTLSRSKFKSSSFQYDCLHSRVTILKHKLLPEEMELIQ